ncbi:MAG: DUF288 domain-containing protein [Verrucomicrobiaceae bacterium]|nr:MAG: DUF288 domain-containing protein [Verrucomicrobiaceae bacterium]
MPKHSIVVTSINSPTDCVELLASGALEHGWNFYVAGDTKTPEKAYAGREDILFLGIGAQKSSGFALSSLVPERTYGRKMFGYLQAISDGSDYIIDTDDDNRPKKGFFQPRDTLAFCGLTSDQCVTFSDAGWVNIYRYFATAANIWPRGNPLSEIKTPLPVTGCLQPVKASIFQGLADGAPDIDAVHRLVHPHSEFLFEDRPPLQLVGNTWCSFNSQNTTWSKDVFLLLYLPLTCSFRMTDIYRSYIAQRIVRELGQGVVFHSATVHQDRNEHSIIRDFRDEVMNYLDDGLFAQRLDALDLAGMSLADMLRECYACGTLHGYVTAAETDYLQAWIGDCGKLGVAL